MIKMELINASYDNIEKKELNIKVDIGSNIYNIYILPIYKSSGALISIYQNNIPIIINRVAVLNECLISYNNAKAIQNIDFVFMYNMSDDVHLDFDIKRLGLDLNLYLVTEVDYEI